MQPSITVDASKFNQQLIKLSKAVGIEAKELVIGEARMVARDLIRLTPPYGTNRKAHLQGLRAVTNDFTRAVRPMKAENWQDKRIQKAIRQRDVSKLNTMFQHIPKLSRKRVVSFSKDVHRATQDNRYRVRRGTWGKTMTPDRRQWRDRLKELQGRVGWLKSRWGVAFLALGGRTLPRWIKKHTISSKNALVDPSRLVGEAPTVTIGNLNPGARTQTGYNVQRAIRRAGNRMRDKFIKVMLGHKFDIKNGVVRIHRPKQEGFSA